MMHESKSSLQAFSVRSVISGVMLLCLIIIGCRCDPVDSSRKNTGAGSSGTGSYADDRALIEDLQARYMFALDFGDLENYVATFTEDGILDIGVGEWRSRDTIYRVLSAINESEEETDNPGDQELHPATGRHHISNIVIRIDGDTAYGRAYWFHMSNDNPQRSATLDSYGHYEDVMVRVNGSWLFARRKIFNEQVPDWAATTENPSW